MSGECEKCGEHALECKCKKHYRKKPIIIEAEQWFPDKEIEGVTRDYFSRSDGSKELCNEWATIIYGPAGDKLTVWPGDWIITDVDGEKYPCKPDIFEKTYELVD